jgi:hypothetical protein
VSPGATFERVYLALKQLLVGGAFCPGQQLEPAHLADDLTASVTPVRDALHRLVGERLVETPRNDGFRVPLVTEAALRDLYRWSERLLLIPLRGRGMDPGAASSLRSAPTGPPPAPEQDIAELFLLIARLSGIREHQQAVAGMNDRLGPVRLKEAVLFNDVSAEAAGIAEALERRDAGTLRRLVIAYHRRRERHASDLLELLQPIR